MSRRWQGREPQPYRVRDVRLDHGTVRPARSRWWRAAAVAALVVLAVAAEVAGVLVGWAAW